MLSLDFALVFIGLVLIEILIDDIHEHRVMHSIVIEQQYFVIDRFFISIVSIVRLVQ